MNELQTGPLQQLVLLGAHPDDIVIGAGASILGLCKANPGLKVSALVLTGAGTEREAEERSALAACCSGAELSVTVAGLADGFVPDRWADAKESMLAFRTGLAGEVDVVLAPQLGDAHQDHRVVAELAGQLFRSQLLFGYEILKYESDLPAVNVYLPVTQSRADLKVSLLHEHYRSQWGRGWFDDEAFKGLMRLRGAQCGEHFAEGFVGGKLTISTGD